jgi:SOS-response transcriptional repressor LexA
MAVVSMVRAGEYSILSLAWPGKPVRNIGVMLRNPADDRPYCHLNSDWDEDTDTEYLSALAEDILVRSREMGADAFLRWCEDTLSNVLVISDRLPVEVSGSFRVTLDRLFEEHVGPIPVAPYRTHLPFYSLAAAAGLFGEDRTVDETGDGEWVPAPEGLRLDEGMFVIRVVGRSMEPRIPDGSLNVFRAPVVGSRQGRIVLARKRSGFIEGAPCTVKRYTSEKSFSGEDEWRHEAIVLEPLNPEYQPVPLEPEECVVLAEWVRTLE